MSTYTKHNIDEPIQFGRGIVSLFTLRKLPTTTFNFNEALQCFKDVQVDALFEEPAPPTNKKLKVETVAEHAKAIDQEISSAMRRSSSSSGGRRLRQEAEDVVQEWFKMWTAHGREGSIGLVPVPVMDVFPTNDVVHLDEEVKEYLVHFYEYMQTRKGLH